MAEFAEEEKAALLRDARGARLAMGAVCASMGSLFLIFLAFVGEDTEAGAAVKDTSEILRKIAKGLASYD